MVLGKLPVPGRPTILMIVGQGPIALAVGAGGGCLDFFTRLFPFSSFSPSLWETARYRLKYCLKGPLNPKQQQQQQPSVLNFSVVIGIYISLQMTINPSILRWVVLEVFTFPANFIQSVSRTFQRLQKCDNHFVYVLRCYIKKIILK